MCFNLYIPGIGNWMENSSLRYLFCCKIFLLLRLKLGKQKIGQVA